MRKMKKKGSILENDQKKKCDNPAFRDINN